MIELDKNIEAFDALRHWCQTYHAVIYEDCGSLMMCLGNQYYRAELISKNYGTWKPFQKISYEPVVVEKYEGECGS
jgi:hypothetical protein